MWLEVIEFNSEETKSFRTELAIEKLINKLRGNENHCVSKVYSRVSEYVDFKIHLDHTSEYPEKTGSPLGKELYLVLKEHGPVKHSIWV